MTEGEGGSGRPADRAREGSAAGDGPRPWRVDLHCHTHRSYDSLSAPADVVRHARDAGLDRLAVTDHDEIRGAFEARELDPDLVIVGEEVRTAQGLDLIGLFLSEWIPPGADFRDVADAIRGQGGIVYLPHPFDAFRGADESFLDAVADRVDLVEGFNGRIRAPERNRRAREWAARHDLPIGAGSDAHLLREIGRARLVVPPFRGSAGLLRAARDGRLEGEPSSPLVHLGSTWAKLRKKLPL